jgi:hypothetical protein
VIELHRWIFSLFALRTLHLFGQNENKVRRAKSEGPDGGNPEAIFGGPSIPSENWVVVQFDVGQAFQPDSSSKTSG